MKAKDLKNIGLKATIPRIKILEILSTSKNHHMSVDDIYRELLFKNEEIGIATIYRVLTQFEKAGIVQKLNFEDGQSVFEIISEEHHDHLICIKCGGVDEFKHDLIEKCQLEIANNFNYKLTDHSLYLYGICAKCL